MSVRARKIESAVKGKKGITFTSLKEDTGLSNGVLQYHIKNSDKIFRKNGALHYEGACENCKFSEKCDDRCIQVELEKNTLRKVKELYEEGERQVDIADELDLTRATVNYHVNKLRDMDLIDG